ncbi:hypothetical protein KIN20_007320 [Parelaphostrongylus tenuis]|uniref:Secreted protein n=1 Tax=Parelaphostrongylus tenuis TaxID=148309 RepID=A0AAD5MPG9_PARTN|nr:hypothetical protein KIN20_007320 [Parelaphostrongylus tenuis]
MRAWRFNVIGFSLLVAVASSTEATARPQALGTLPNLNGAEAYVKHFVIEMLTKICSIGARLFEQQGRAASLPDAIIAIILSQFLVNVLHTPLPCPLVSALLTNDV